MGTVHKNPSGIHSMNSASHAQPLISQSCVWTKEDQHGGWHSQHAACRSTQTGMPGSQKTLLWNCPSVTLLYLLRTGTGGSDRISAEVPRCTVEIDQPWVHGVLRMETPQRSFRSIPAANWAQDPGCPQETVPTKCNIANKHNQDVMQERLLDPTLKHNYLNWNAKRQRLF